VSVPSQLAPYLDEVVARLQAMLGSRLVGVYAGGPVALGAYQQGRSDIDVAPVAEEQVSRSERESLGAVLRHEALPCPARGLELVLYPLETARGGGADPGFLLNLNTGRRMAFRLDLDPVPEASHWFAIDRSILAQRGVTLAGPPAGEVFAPVAQEVLFPLLARSLEWHLEGIGRGDDAVLNAARAWRYLTEERWSSKAEAGGWALTRVADPSLVRRALRARKGGRDVRWDEAAAFVAEVRRHIEQ